MAKINDTEIYKKEDFPTLLDFLVGTKEVNGKTKSFPLKSVIQLINGVNGKNNIQYKFSDGTNPEIDYTTPGSLFTNTNTTEVTTFSSLIFNKSALSGYDLSTLFNFLESVQNLYFKIDNPLDPNIFFNFKITSIENQTEYFVLNVEPYNGLYIGELSNELIYSIYWDTKDSSSITIVPYGKQSAFKVPPNIDNNALEINDEVDCIVADLTQEGVYFRITGVYLGGDVIDKESYDIWTSKKINTV